MLKVIVLITLNAGSHRTAEENLGLSYLAAVLRHKGYAVTVIDGWLYGLGQEAIIRKLEEIPGILFIGISSYRSSLPEAACFIARLRSAGIAAPVVAGGYGPTFYPEDYFRAGADFVVAGEGERPITSLAEDLMAGKLIGRRYFQGGFTQKLDDLPWPERDTLERSLEMKNPVHVSTSRGCFGRCEFCAVQSFAGLSKASRWRERNVVDVVDEIAKLNELYGVSDFKIVDDSFIEPPRDASWAYGFGNELAKRGLKVRFRTQIKAECLDEELVANLVGAGWFATSIGVENWSQPFLSRHNKRATVDDNRKAIGLLKQYGVLAQMGMILFDDQTTLSELKENLEALRVLDWPVYKGIFSMAYVSAGTPLFARLSAARPMPVGPFGNYAYEVSDNRARTVFTALRAWQNSHAQTIEHAVNPIDHSASWVFPVPGDMPGTAEA